MSEQIEHVESACDEATQKTAEAQGWIPATRYKGEPEHFVDADEFIKRGETVLPIVKKQLERTRGELADVRAQAATTLAALNRATKAIDEINERHTVATQKAVERAIADVKGQLKAASEAGDHDAVAELTDTLVDLRTAKEEPPPAKKVEEVVQPPALDPEVLADFNAWKADNPLWDEDADYKALVLSIGDRLRREGDRTVGRAFFDKVGGLAAKKFRGAEPPPNDDKVSGGRHGESGGGGARGGKTFASLPPEAKEAARRDEREFVGPTKRYKTPAEWHKRYAELYYQNEA